jgi:hypothetical protein
MKRMTQAGIKYRVLLKVESTHTATWSEHDSSPAVLSQPVRLHTLIRSQSHNAFPCARCKRRKIFVVRE